MYERAAGPWSFKKKIKVLPPALHQSCRQLLCDVNYMFKSGGWIEPTGSSSVDITELKAIFLVIQHSSKICLKCTFTKWCMRRRRSDKVNLVYGGGSHVVCRLQTLSPEVFWLLKQQRCSLSRKLNSLVADTCGWINTAISNCGSFIEH